MPLGSNPKPVWSSMIPSPASSRPSASLLIDDEYLDTVAGYGNGVLEIRHESSRFIGRSGGAMYVRDEASVSLTLLCLASRNRI